MEIILGEKQIVKARYKGFEIITDQPEKAGGDNSALSPFDLFMVSIGTCAGWYVKSFCQQRNLSEEGIRLEQKTRFNPDKRLIDKIEIEIHLPADFPDKYREPLIKAAGACTVKKHVMDAPEFSIVTIK
ncbi:MAG: osmotically inducible protein OsmC [Bacteroidetes bacterium]|nr:MAG: osmotically inducible protein OsmC [Bacteroidota bacterium]